MRRLLLILSLILLLLGAGTYWLAGRDATLRWALDKVVAATQGQLQFDGVSGNLLGTVRMEHARFSSPETAVNADRVALDFSLAALLQRRLEIDRLQADSLFVKLVPSDEPLQPPSTLEQITKYLLVSMPLPGPTMISHQPGLRSAASWKPATWASPVRAWQSSTALLRSALSVP